MSVLEGLLGSRLLTPSSVLFFYRGLQLSSGWRIRFLMHTVYHVKTTIRNNSVLLDLFRRYFKDLDYELKSTFKKNSSFLFAFHRLTE